MTLLYGLTLTPIGLIVQLKEKTLIAIPLCLVALGLQQGLGSQVLFGEYTTGGVLCNLLTIVILVTTFVVLQMPVYKVLCLSPSSASPANVSTTETHRLES